MTPQNLGPSGTNSRSQLIHAHCPCCLPVPRREPNKFYKRANSWKMLVFKNILREFACCSFLCGDGIYTPSVSAAPHLRALYIAINYTLVVEWLSTGNLISHYPLSNIQHTAVNICISRKSSWLPLVGCRNVREDSKGSAHPPLLPKKPLTATVTAFTVKLVTLPSFHRSFGLGRCHQLTAHCSTDPAP